MGNNLERQLSMRKQATGFAAELAEMRAEVNDLKATVPQLAMATNQALNQANQLVATLQEQLDAVIGLVGLSEVQRAIQETRLANMKEAAEKTKANIAEAVANGQLVKVDTINEKSLFVGREFNADGTEIPPGYTAVSYNQVKKEYREKLSGQTVGFALSTDSGGKFEVLEIYEAVEPKPEEKPAAPAVDAAAVAASETQPPTEAAATEG